MQPIDERADYPMTIEDLFRSYDGQPFEAELVDLGPAVGEEKW
jgi:hypothetical protein